jgi:hypothetical protein
MIKFPFFILDHIIFAIHKNDLKYLKICIGHKFTCTWDTFNIAWQNIEHMQEEKVCLPITMS